MGKRLPPKKRAVKRAPTPRVAKTATPRAKKSAPKKSGQSASRTAQRARSEAAKRGWETRKQRAAEAEAAREAKAEKRAAAARKGWAKRHAKALEAEGLHPRSAQVLGQLSADQQQLLHNMRLAVLGPMGWSEELTGRDPGGLQVLRDMVTHRDKRWETFTKYALEAGFSSQAARTAFFSPSVKRMSRASAPGLRP